MIRYILLTLNIIVFKPIFSIFIIFVGLFDSKKKIENVIEKKSEIINNSEVKNLLK